MEVLARRLRAHWLVSLSQACLMQLLLSLIEAQTSVWLMRNNLRNFLIVGLSYHLWLLYVVFELLDPIEALSLILPHRVFRIIVQNVPNHGLVTYWVKFLIIARFDTRELLRIFMEWLDVIFQLVSEISDEFFTVVQSHHHGLVIYGCPLAFLERATVDASFD